MKNFDGTISHVTDTALWVAHYRAQETSRADALFHDPLAKVLVGERGKQIAEKMTSSSKYTAWLLPIRTRVIDDYIMALIGEGVDLVLNLGAGLDTRPYRLELPPSLRWIEIDYPQMIEHKETLLSNEKPRCQLERIQLDLADREKRRGIFQSIASRSKKILVLTEGVIPYLTEAQVSELAEDLRAQDSVKFWIGEYMNPNTYKYLKSKKRTKQMANAPFQFYPEDWMDFFKARGWVPREVKYLVIESERLNRKMPIPWYSYLLRPFMSAEMVKAFRQMMGYVIFTKA